MRERILKRARSIKCEDFAIRLLNEGKSEDQITDALLNQAVRFGYAKGSGLSIDAIDDETFIRGLTNPNPISLD